MTYDSFKNLTPAEIAEALKTIGIRLMDIERMSGLQSRHIGQQLSGKAPLSDQTRFILYLVVELSKINPDFLSELVSSRPKK